MSSFAAALESLDLSLFESIESQTTSEDKRSLLALHVACRRKYESFAWLEIGSHLGGSLQTLVRDPRCARITSIDTRPYEQPDERMGFTEDRFRYPENSTKRMLDRLGSVPGANLEIVRTYEVGTEVLDPEAIDPPQVCFVDGEHTNEACARDADFCRRAVRDRGVIAFHDIGVIYGAVAAFVDQLTTEGIPHRTAYLPDAIFAVELGVGGLLEDHIVVSRRLLDGNGVLGLLKSNDRYRAFLQGRRARLLRKLGMIPREY